MLTTLTTVGYGDFLPASTEERAFTIVILIFGVTYFAYLMGSINSAIADFNTQGIGDFQAELNIWLDSIEKLYGPI